MWDTIGVSTEMGGFYYIYVVDDFIQHELYDWTLSEIMKISCVRTLSECQDISSAWTLIPINGHSVCGHFKNCGHLL